MRKTYNKFKNKKDCRKKKDYKQNMIRSYILRKLAKGFVKF